MNKIMSVNKTILPSLINRDQKKIQEETERMNNASENILTDIIELNQMIYAGEKFIIVEISGS